MVDKRAVAKYHDSTILQQPLFIYKRLRLFSDRFRICSFSTMFSTKFFAGL